jgi:hypothetical protein
MTWAAKANELYKAVMTMRKMVVTGSFLQPVVETTQAGV